jgi:hypothetical protein
MAAKDSLEASVTKLRHLFTSAERRVLDSAVAKSLADAGEKQVKAVLGQARVLRDKWRDLVGAQARRTKRGGKRVGPYPVTAAVSTNQRSRDKTDLLSATVARLESRLAELTGASGKSPKQSAAKPAAPSVRVAAAKKTRITKRGTKSAISPTASPASLTSRAIAKKAVSKKARQAGALQQLESAAVQGLKSSASSQRRVSAALKAERLKLKGITTRRAGHTQARGGRAQARRDGRNAGR